MDEHTDEEIKSLRALVEKQAEEIRVLKEQAKTLLLLINHSQEDLKSALYILEGEKK